LSGLSEASTTQKIIQKKTFPGKIPELPSKQKAASPRRQEVLARKRREFVKKSVDAPLMSPKLAMKPGPD